MGNISKNFDRAEFMCKCGCGKALYNERFLEKLQTLRDYIKTPITISSGYRCRKHDIAVGGSGTGTHTLGIAADISAKGYTAKKLAYCAEQLGFGGIGIINNMYLHVDMRDESGHGFTYANKHWYGDEQTGNNDIKTFKE